MRLSLEFQGLVNSWLKYNHLKAARTKLAQYSNRANSQAAHEAIRPLQVECREIGLNRDCQSLYHLIWNRAIASQCTEAVVEQMRVEIVVGDKRLIAQGQRVIKAGYTIFWHNLKAERLLPELVEGQSLVLQKVETIAEQTQPPSRFNEPGLVKRLETEGIGRPSTYATIIATLKNRGYIKRESKKLIPTQLGLEVDDFLGRVVPKLIHSSFTAQMENSLDQIAQGKLDWQNYLVQWYEADFFPALVKGQQLAETEFALPPDQETAYICQFCAQPGLVKISSNDPRLGIDHYLKCAECNSPHFWKEGKYQIPYRLRRRAQAKNLTDYKCPVCQAPLECYGYQRQGQKQEMLRCSELNQKKCCDVAYFPTPAGWNSKKFGLMLEGSSIDFFSII